MTIDAGRARLPGPLPGGGAWEYVYAVVGVAFAALVAYALELRLDPIVVAPFLAAVAVAAARGGFGPALLATALAAAVCYTIFLSPLLLLDLDQGTLWRLTVFRLALFVAAALVLTAAAGLRRRIEEELRRSQRQLLRFVADASVGLYEITPDGRITWADDAACDLLGRARPDVVGRPLIEFLVDGPVAAAILSCTRDDAFVENARARVRRLDGSLAEVLVNANGSWRQADGTPQRMLFAMLPAAAPDPAAPSALVVTPINASRRPHVLPPRSVSA